MDSTGILIATLVSFIVSIFSVATGGTSLITVPLFIWLGMTSKNALATNMFALIFLSAGGAARFRQDIEIPDYKMVVLFSALTICASLIGANLVVVINENILRKIIAIMICVIVGSFLLKKDLGAREKQKTISPAKLFAGSILVFILGIYGGFFSGGYVTLLSYILILTFGLNFLQVAFITKIFNIFSSLAACVLFYYRGLIDFSAGVPLALSMFLGGFLGAKLAIAKGNLWIRNLFIAVAITLALKLLLS